MPMPAARRENRRHYRLRYPMRLRPRLEVSGQQAEVIDISEGGIRIVNESGLPIVLGEAFNAALKLRSGEAARLSGCVIRISPDEVAVSFARGLSFASILREQRALRTRRYWAP
jgi:c-di-GMP-binding flagellar brake protein YcgR